MIKQITAKILAEKKRFFKFAIVGCSGIIVNLCFVWLGNNIFFAARPEVFKTTVSYAIAILASILSNYSLNFLWTWADRRAAGVRSFLVHMLKYYAASLVAAGLQFLIAISLTFLLKITFFSRIDAVPVLFKMGASFAGIVVGMLTNFLLNHNWTFKESGKQEREI